jgi:transposase
MAAVVSSANCTDRDGFKALLHFFSGKLVLPKKIFLDAAYSGEEMREEAARYGIELEIVKRSEKQTEFKVQPKRWIVERTFAWFGKCRRLSKDYEGITATSCAFLYLAMIRLMLRRITSMA